MNMSLSKQNNERGFTCTRLLDKANVLTGKEGWSALSALLEVEAGLNWLFISATLSPPNTVTHTRNHWVRERSELILALKHTNIPCVCDQLLVNTIVTREDCNFAQLSYNQYIEVGFKKMSLKLVK